MAVSPYKNLHEALPFARDNLSGQWFPKYTQTYVDYQTGMKQRAIQVYNQAHTISSTISGVILFVPSKIAFVANYVFEKMPNFTDSFIFKYPKKAYNYVLPINPINQKRQGFRWVDKILGDWIFYPMYTFGESPSTELLPRTNTNVSQPVSEVVTQILNKNQGLLNPEGQTKFDYRIQTIISNQINAFCVPGGGMVVYSQLVKELHGSIHSKDIQEAMVKLPDGSEATIDLRDITLQDALAGLVGHEITHAAARHSIVGMVAAAVSFIVKILIQGLSIQYLKHRDSEYRELVAKKDNLSEDDRLRLEEKEKGLSRAGEAIGLALNFLKNLYMLIRSRANEIESDVAGVYLAKEADYNPLGALYLQTFLQQKNQNHHYRIEALCSHPNAEKRKLAALSAITSFDPDSLRGKITIKDRPEKYEFDHSQDKLRKSLQNLL